MRRGLASVVGLAIPWQQKIPSRARIAILCCGAARPWIGDDPADDERRRLSEEFADWTWRPRYCGCEFDYADEADFRRGIYRLRAKINVGPIAEEEVRATGWERNDYAPLAQPTAIHPPRHGV